jgi:hypothetical protein
MFSSGLTGLPAIYVFPVCSIGGVDGIHLLIQGRNSIAFSGAGGHMISPKLHLLPIAGGNITGNCENRTMPCALAYTIPVDLSIRQIMDISRAKTRESREMAAESRRSLVQLRRELGIVARDLAGAVAGANAERGKLHRQPK